MSTSTTITNSSYTKNVTTVTWEINNFSVKAFCNDLNYSLKSEVFKLDKTRQNFYMTFRHIKSQDLFTNDSPMIYLMPFDLDTEVQLNYKCHIENSSHTKIATQPMNECRFNEFGNQYEKPNCAQYKLWFSLLNSFIKNGEKIFIKCEIERISNKQDFEPSELDGNSGLRLFEAHQLDTESGLCVIEVGNEKFRIDKSLLMMHSTVFASLLKDGALKNGVISMKEYSSVAVKTFVASLYAGYILNTVFVEDLLVLADKFKVVWMKREAEFILGKNLSLQNVFKRMHLASNYSCQLLKNKVLHFASKSDHFETIIQNNEWNQLALKDKRFADEILTLGFENLKIKAKLSESKKTQKSCFSFFGPIKG